MNAANLSPAGQCVYEAVCSCVDPDRLDEIGKSLWQLYGEGAVSDDEADFLSQCIAGRRPLRRDAPRSLSQVGSRLSRFRSRQRPRSPDREASRKRRRVLGGSSALPDTLRHHYTEGQRAVLCIVAGEVKRNGRCALPIDQIAALAGVCRTTVQTTMHEARLLGHIRITERPRPGRKNLTNIVEIVSHEWCVWLHRSGSEVRKRIGSRTANLMSPTKIKERKKRARGSAKAPSEGRGPAIRLGRDNPSAQTIQQTQSDAGPSRGPTACGGFGPRRYASKTMEN